MVHKTTFPISIVALFFLAGCVGAVEESATQSAESTGPAEFDEATGGIEGIVLDDESKPVAGAFVAILETETRVVTDAAGYFSFSNLEPGRATVVVNKLGYDGSATLVEVMAGQVASVQLSVAIIRVYDAFYEVIPKDGFFECTWRTAVSSGVCGYLGGVNDTTGNPLEDYVFTNSKRKWNYDAGPGAMTILNEMTWTAGSAATGDNLRIFFSYADRTPSHTFCQADGYNPLPMEWKRDAAEDDDFDCPQGSNGGGLGEMDTIDWEDGLKVQSFVSVGVARVNGQSTAHGFAYQQRFQMWFSLFYYDWMPEDYSALADA